MVLFELPPGQKWREYELKALGLRDFACVRPNAPLNPFVLASFANLLVVKIDKIEGLSKESKEHLMGAAAEEWSGGACSKPLPNGLRIVILNPKHGPATDFLCDIQKHAQFVDGSQTVRKPLF